ncbi:hypothetical protein KCH_04890 [Kitasatospora cheerisanensis KCTC 2395]|uniref:ABC3 transporter permease C-terminal domain-containing protein n=1 Tax=Kitasatospora cheerisanensis KCTC 2395 TaxID=1348663 RepID=A0A066Z2W7_9ACTN|nr:hypothetical protein KCH_04890 [Kitasatospora cheerisanensis KCTC 2395]
MIAAEAAAIGVVRRAAAVRPVEALGEARGEPARAGRARTFFGVLLFLLGAGASLLPLYSGSVFAVAGAGTGGLVMIVAVLMLAPPLVRLAVRLLAGPVRRRTGPHGQLAVANARAHARRLAAGIGPLTLAVGFALVQLGIPTTIAAAAEQQAAAGVRAEFTLQGGPGGLPPGVVEAAAALPGVAASTGVVRVAVHGSRKVLDSPEIFSYQAQGVTGDPARTLDLGVVAGSPADLHGDTAAVSATAAATLGVRVGDRIRLTLPDGTGIRPTVVAVYRRGLGFGEVTLPQQTVLAHSTRQLEDAVFVRTAAGADPRRVAGALRGLAARYPGLEVLDRGGLSAAQRAQAGASVLTSALPLALVFGYLAIAVANTLVLATLGRAREFALLRLVGAPPRQVLRMVRVEAGMAVAVAVAAGTAVPLLPLATVSLGLTGSPVPHVPVPLYLAIVAPTALVGFAAILLPTRFALRTRRWRPSASGSDPRPRGGCSGPRGGAGWPCSGPRRGDQAAVLHQRGGLLQAAHPDADLVAVDALDAGDGGAEVAVEVLRVTADDDRHQVVPAAGRGGEGALLVAADLLADPLEARQVHLEPQGGVQLVAEALGQRVDLVGERARLLQRLQATGHPRLRPAGQLGQPGVGGPAVLGQRLQQRRVLLPGRQRRTRRHRAVRGQPVHLAGGERARAARPPGRAGRAEGVQHQVQVHVQDRTGARQLTQQQVVARGAGGGADDADDLRAAGGDARERHLRPADQRVRQGLHRVRPAAQPRDPLRLAAGRRIAHPDDPHHAVPAQRRVPARHGLLGDVQHLAEPPEGDPGRAAQAVDDSVVQSVGHEEMMTSGPPEMVIPAHGARSPGRSGAPRRKLIGAPGPAADRRPGGGRPPHGRRPGTAGETPQQPKEALRELRHDARPPGRTGRHARHGLPGRLRRLPARHHRVGEPAGDPARPARLHRPTLLGLGRVRAADGRADPHHRRARRRPRPQEGLPGRHGLLRARRGDLAVLRLRAGPVGRAGRLRHRRRRAAAQHPGADQPRRARPPRARPVHRLLGDEPAGLARRRPADRRPAARARRLALDLPAADTRRRRGPRRRRVPAARLPRPARPPPRLAGPAHRRRRRHRARLRRHRRRRGRLRRTRRRHRAGPRRGRRRGLRGGRTPQRQPDAGPAAVPQPRVHRDRAGGHGQLPRTDRLLLRPQPVLRPGAAPDHPSGRSAAGPGVRHLAARRPPGRAPDAPGVAARPDHLGPAAGRRRDARHDRRRRRHRLPVAGLAAGAARPRHGRGPHSDDRLRGLRRALPPGRDGRRRQQRLPPGRRRARPRRPRRAAHHPRPGRTPRPPRRTARHPADPRHRAGPGPRRRRRARPRPGHRTGARRARRSLPRRHAPVPAGLRGARPARRPRLRPAAAPGRPAGARRRARPGAPARPQRLTADAKRPRFPGAVRRSAAVLPAGRPAGALGRTAPGDAGVRGAQLHRAGVVVVVPAVGRGLEVALPLDVHPQVVGPRPVRAPHPGDGAVAGAVVEQVDVRHRPEGVLVDQVVATAARPARRRGRLGRSSCGHHARDHAQSTEPEGRRPL